MSEELRHIEAQNTPEAREMPETIIPRPEAESSHEEQPIDQEAARAAVSEQLASGAAPLALPVDDTPDGDKPQYISRALKRLTLKKELKELRSQLPVADKMLSSFIHQPVARRVSEASARTVTRPSGLLGGGVFAFFGSLAYLLLTKYVGLKYNYLLFFVFFIVGFTVGVCLEMLIKSARPPKPEQ